MKELSNYGDKRMTVKEVAAALGTAESTIRNKVGELFPELVRNGVATMLTERQVVDIKQAIVPRDAALKASIDDAATYTEMMELANKVMAWLNSSIANERKNIEWNKQRAESMPPKEAGFVYIMHIRNTSYYKIGRTKNLSRREKTLKTGNPMLYCIASTYSNNCVALEKIIHLQFQELRIGGEFFELEQSDIDSLVAQFGFNLQMD